MKPCPNCETQIQEWQTTCHQCGHRNIRDDDVPVVSDPMADSNTVAESFQDWFERGKECLNSKRFEEAIACFQEALRRMEGLNRSEMDSQAKSEAEIKVRSKLAYALEAAGKLVESRAQYEIVRKEIGEDQVREKLKKKTEELGKLSEDFEFRLPSKGEFQAVSRAEAPLVPLYCCGCHRLLSEGEVFGFRKNLIQTVRCVCGEEGRPVARHDNQYEAALAKKTSLSKRKARLVEAASRPLKSGRHKWAAVCLAILGGGFGTHKYYLGDKAHSYIYSLWFLVLAAVGVSLGGIDRAGYSIAANWAGFVVALSLIPWFLGWFEAITYIQMSLVTFNLSYNLHLVREIAPVDQDLEPRRLEVFSMEVTEDPEDYLDDWNEGTS